MIRIAAAMYRTRRTAIISTVALWIIIDVILGCLVFPELLEPGSLLATMIAGICTGLYFHALGRTLQRQ